MGRGSTSGPFAGAYVCISLSPFGLTATPGAVTSITRISIPGAWRLMEVSLSNQSSAGGVSRPTVQITDGTNNLFSGSATLVTADDVVITPTSSPSLVAAQRTRAKGDLLRIQTTTVASEAVAGYSVILTFNAIGHVVALAAND